MDNSTAPLEPPSTPNERSPPADQGAITRSDEDFTHTLGKTTNFNYKVLTNLNTIFAERQDPHDIQVSASDATTTTGELYLPHALEETTTCKGSALKIMDKDHNSETLKNHSNLFMCDKDEEEANDVKHYDGTTIRTANGNNTPKRRHICARTQHATVRQP